MNLLDAKVEKILSRPYFNYNKWWVDVEYSCWGSTGVSNLMFDTEEEALSVNVGHEFLT